MIITQAPATNRVGRYPKHTFQIKEQFFAAVPFMIAPVRPGETLQSVHFEARAVSDPIRSSIIGCKKEYHWFYVRATDLLQDAIREMFVDPTNTDLSATLGIAANDTPYYTAKGGVDYLKRAVTRIVETFFRDDGEVAGTYVNSDGYYMVQNRTRSFLDSLTDKDLMPEGAAMTGATDMGDLDRLLNAFETLRAMGIANMTYEDWLRSQGIAISTEVENKPEHLDYLGDFVYPANTIDPATGVPSSALSWVFRNTLRKAKFFKEPGFIVGISITRPKIYHRGLAGNAAAHLTRMWDWLTNISQMVGPETRLKQFLAGTGPLGDRTTDTDAYWLDMGDLFSYGDQFQNLEAFNAAVAAPAPNTDNRVATPTLALGHKYPDEASLKNMFTTPASAFYVRSDGYTDLAIKGDLRDLTVGTIAEA